MSDDVEKYFYKNYWYVPAPITGSSRPRARNLATGNYIYDDEALAALQGGNVPGSSGDPDAPDWYYETVRYANDDPFADRLAEKIRNVPALTARDPGAPDAEHKLSVLKRTQQATRAVYNALTKPDTYGEEGDSNVRRVVNALLMNGESWGDLMERDPQGLIDYAADLLEAVGVDPGDYHRPDEYERVQLTDSYEPAEFAGHTADVEDVKDRVNDFLTDVAYQTANTSNEGVSSAELSARIAEYLADEVSRVSPQDYNLVEDLQEAAEKYRSGDSGVAETILADHLIANPDSDVWEIIMTSQGRSGIRKAAEWRWNPVLPGDDPRYPGGRPRAVSVHDPSRFIYDDEAIAAIYGGTEPEPAPVDDGEYFEDPIEEEGVIEGFGYESMENYDEVEPGPVPMNDFVDERAIVQEAVWDAAHLTADNERPSSQYVDLGYDLRPNPQHVLDLMEGAAIEDPKLGEVVEEARNWFENVEDPMVLDERLVDRFSDYLLDNPDSKAWNTIRAAQGLTGPGVTKMERLLARIDNLRFKGVEERLNDAWFDSLRRRLD